MNISRNFIRICMMTVLVAVFCVFIKNNIYADEEFKYLIRINAATNCIVVYEKDTNGQYTIIAKTMVCSLYTDSIAEMNTAGIMSNPDTSNINMGNMETGNAGIDIMNGTVVDNSNNIVNGNVADNAISSAADNSTSSVAENSSNDNINSSEIVLATITGKEEWKTATDGTFVRYADNLGELSICTAPYSAQSNNSLITEKYNALGNEKSDSDIWLNCTDAKWIYDNCAVGTTVEIYSDLNDQAVSGRPKSITIPVDSENAGWDPTDEAPENPWNDSTASIEGTRDIQTIVGRPVDLSENVIAYDKCGNDITDLMLIMGNYDFDRAGNYDVTYYVMDATGSTASSSIRITVNKGTDSNSGSKPSQNGNSREKTRGEKIRVLVILGLASMALSVVIIRYTKKD